MFVTVKLKGILGREYGPVHRFLATSPRDVVSALEANFPGFKARILELERWNYRLTTPSNHWGLGEDELGLGIGEELVIRPIVAGSGGNFGRVLLGVALVAASAFMPASIMGISSMSVGLLGGSLILGGILGWLSPKPKERKQDDPNKSFSQASGTAARDAPVPLWVGYLRIEGMPVLSSGIETRDL
jgi:predicted phage tail protein